MTALTTLILAADAASHTQEAPSSGTNWLLLIGGALLFVAICVGILTLFAKSRALNRPPGRHPEGGRPGA